ncbi:MAG: helix-turn-helix transcriptional regulator [Oscillospiraceae bacterium]|nr:helix-turn-helix transcriptional regulator [Oscillospiraceae bacterium]
MKNDIGFLQILSDLSGIPVVLWLTERVDEYAWASGTSSHPCLNDGELRAALERHTRKGTPNIYFADEQAFYGVIPIGPFSLAIGPAAIGTASGSGLRKSDADMVLAKTDLATLTQYMKLAYCHFTGTPAAQEEFPLSVDVLEQWQSGSDLESYQLNQSENERTYQIGADFEKALLQAVKGGDIEALKSLLSSSAPASEEIMELTLPQSKESEYMAVSTITLLTRAAIAGGAAMETAHELGAVYLNRVGKAASRGESVFGLSYGAMIEFTELVRRSKEEKSALSYVEACKQYIEKHFRRKLEVSEIAPAIGISRTYLSRLFRETEGITIQQYIQKVKCRHAAQMLQYSTHSISQIAQYNGFSSQSYFGSCFLAWYGMSPLAYRKANQKDLIHD